MKRVVKKVKRKIRRKKMDINAETLTVNGIEYVKKGSAQSEKINQWIRTQ